MASEGITIARRLPEELRGDAARVFDAAFGEKMAFVIRSDERRLAFIEQHLVADRCVVALDGDQLLGLLGLNAASGVYAGGLLAIRSLDLATLRTTLGLARAVWARLALRAFDHEPDPGELYIDNIAVGPAARGRGVGTLLLDEAAAIGREGGFDVLRLGVIDTNPRAKALYEREGYTVVKEQRWGLLRPLIGFGGEYTMERPLSSETSPA